jgi:hypothetical protein
MVTADLIARGNAAGALHGAPQPVFRRLASSSCLVSDLALQ